MIILHLFIYQIEVGFVYLIRDGELVWPTCNTTPIVSSPLFYLSNFDDENRALTWSHKLTFPWVLGIIKKTASKVAFFTLLRYHTVLYAEYGKQNSRKI